MGLVSSTRIWGAPPAGGPLLKLPTAQAGRGSSPNSRLQNLTHDGMPKSVHGKDLLPTFFPDHFPLCTTHVRHLHRPYPTFPLFHSFHWRPRPHARSPTHAAFSVSHSVSQTRALKATHNKHGDTDREGGKDVLCPLLDWSSDTETSKSSTLEMLGTNLLTGVESAGIRRDGHCDIGL